MPYAMNDPLPLLAYMSIVAFRWLRASSRAKYQAAGIAAAIHKNYLVGCGIADAIASGPNLNAPLPEDVVILKALVRHPNRAVRHLTFIAIRRLGAHENYERASIDMLLVSEVGADSKLADEMCGAVDYQGINKEHLSEDQIRVLLEKLVITKEVDQHHTGRFLGWVGQYFPDALFEFVLRRLDHDAEIERRGEKKAGYTPIPHTQFGNAFRALQNSPKYQTFLEQATNRFTTQPEQAFWLRSLFWSIASLDPTSLRVIDG